MATHPFYNRMDNLAINKIAEYGRDMSLSRTTDSGKSYNPIQTTSEDYIIGLQTKFTTAQDVKWQVSVQDKAIMLSSTVKPIKSDRLIDDGVAYTIKHVEEFKPADIVLYYKLQVRL